MYAGVCGRMLTYADCPLNLSSKVSRLLEDLGKVMTHKEKAVVFTQHKQVCQIVYIHTYIYIVLSKDHCLNKALTWP
jgi:hypothetical protein